jgi:hypothetical protein
MDVLAGPQSTQAQREELAELAGILGLIPASEDTYWPAVAALFATSDYIKCGVAVAIVDVVAAAFGLIPTVINI